MTPDDWIQQLKKAYPKRARGKNYNWPVAIRHLRGHLKNYPFDMILSGTEEFCKAMKISGDYGTEFIPMASTFYGPQERFLDEYETEGPELAPLRSTVSHEPTEAERLEERRKGEENLRKLQEMAGNVRMIK